MNDTYKITKSSYGNISASDYTDWRTAFDAIKNKDQKVILELGLGEGTVFLLNNFKNVYSFEGAKSDEWYKKTSEIFKDDSRWKSAFLSLNEIGLDIADEELIKSGGEIRNIDPLNEYFKRLDAFIESYDNIDVAFVDQGFHFRGESVNYFLQKGIKEIVAHDTNGHDKIYGYDKVVLPDRYVKQVYGGMGTTVFIKF